MTLHLPSKPSSPAPVRPVVTLEMPGKPASQWRALHVTHARQFNRWLLIAKADDLPVRVNMFRSLRDQSIARARASR